MHIVIGFSITVLLMGCHGDRSSARWPKERSSPAETIESPHQQESASEAFEFKDIQGGRGKTEDGVPFSYHLYKSSDGVGVSTTVENRISAFSAVKALQRKIKTASKIIERGSRLDVKGQRTGEKVVAMFKSDGSNKERAAVFWTDGSDFHYLESSSLPHLIAFEKKYYPGPR